MLWLSIFPWSADEVAAGGGGAAREADLATRCLPLAWWALQFTPRVACVEGAVLLEVAASLRLFGGANALRHTLLHQRERGWAPAFEALAWAPTGLAALAWSRHIRAQSAVRGEGAAQPAPVCDDATERPLADQLDALPLHTLSAVAAHRPMLERLGCRTLGEVRRLPRAGLARRFGSELLQALDQAYGLQPEAYTWVTLPDVFDERLELPWRVDSAPALMTGADVLLRRLQAWLMARHAGVRAVVLRWQHDFGARSAGAGGELTVRTAQPAQQVDHLARLLAEHLAQTTLLAPVGELALQAVDIEPLPPSVWSLLPPDVSAWSATDEAGARAWQTVAERLSVRLGAAQVLRPMLQDDHRPGHLQRWEPVCAEQLAGVTAPMRVAEPRAPYGPHCPADHTPQPCWLLDEPQPLSVHQDRPHYQGPLRLLAGPHRVESGWWDVAESGGAPGALGASGGSMARDYFVAASPRAGLLWIFRSHACGWFLHGIYG
ncbi:DNA polymerase Y family protein [Aquabacterium sp.]|uniref:Y-family DNA polymerase n=1 Tax=Aquabacterium sp. TaxID=1872578 RepID=UPI0035AE5CDA